MHPIVQRILSYRENKAIRWGHVEQDYVFIADCMHTWRNNKHFPANSVVAVNMKYDPLVISLVLHLITNNNIIVPTPDSPDAINYIQNSEAQYYLNAVYDTNIKNWTYQKGIPRDENKRPSNEQIRELQDKNVPVLATFSVDPQHTAILSMEDLEDVLNRFSPPSIPYRSISALPAYYKESMLLIIRTMLEGGMFVCPDSLEPEDICIGIAVGQVEKLLINSTLLSDLVTYNMGKDYNISYLKEVICTDNSVGVDIINSLQQMAPHVEFVYQADE